MLGAYKRNEYDSIFQVFLSIRKAISYVMWMEPAEDKEHGELETLREHRQWK